MSNRHPWWTGLAAWSGTLLLHTLASTWRVEPRLRREVQTVLREHSPAVFALWHSRLLALTTTHRNCGVQVLVSQHHDGELIARILAGFGFTTARGSSTRGGELGAREMLRGAEAGGSFAMTPDGPRGPAEQVKPGIVHLASRSGLPVVTVGAASAPAWRLRSWDGFQVPKPFARVAVAHGEPIVVPADLARDAVEPWRLRVEQSLNDANARARARLEGGA